jgi:hypothetical protein
VVVLNVADELLLRVGDVLTDLALKG